MNETSSTIPENEISEASAEKTDEGASQDKASSMPEFKLERFDGPLDLLITLIARHKLDIYDIPIAQILEQYLDYLDRMKEADTEITMDNANCFDVQKSSIEGNTVILPPAAVAAIEITLE